MRVRTLYSLYIISILADELSWRRRYLSYIYLYCLQSTYIHIIIHGLPTRIYTQCDETVFRLLYRQGTQRSRFMYTDHFERSWDRRS